VSSSPPAAPGRIYVSYREQDTGDVAGRLLDRLVDHFGVRRVVRGVTAIDLGDHFAEAISAEVGSCDVVLVLIGTRWLTDANQVGRRWLDDPDDVVRLEIEAALARGVRVLPILVNEARMPRSDELPPPLVGIVRRQALELTQERFDLDTSRLLWVLDRILVGHPALREQGDTPSPKVRARHEQRKPKSGVLACIDPRQIIWIVVAAGLLLSTIVGTFLLQRQQASGPQAVTVQYEGTVELRGEEWQITDRLILDDQAVLNLALPIGSSIYRANRQIIIPKERDHISVVKFYNDNLRGILEADLAKKDWELETTIDGLPQFYRVRTLKQSNKAFPLWETHTVLEIDSLDSASDYSLLPRQGSRLKVIAPSRFVGTTGPPGERNPLPGKREEISISLDPTDTEVEVQILSPLLQSEQGELVSRLTTSGWFGWGVALAVGALVLLLKGKIARLGGRFVMTLRRTLPTAWGRIVSRVRR
jgi:hypothetical protein